MNLHVMLDDEERLPISLQPLQKQPVGVLGPAHVHSLAVRRKGSQAALGQRVDRRVRANDSQARAFAVRRGRGTTGSGAFSASAAKGFTPS